jgi:pimeloyl-ACP methyl ester carboxylesterase
VNVDLVSVETEDGVHLDGALRMPMSNSTVQFGLDLVICHHGVAGNFYRPSLFDAVGDDLLRAGCAVLRANSRGHDTAFPVGVDHAQASVGVSLGAAFEIVDDCRHDWKAWLDFAERSGYRNVALWGHSLGAVTIYYLANVPEQRVECAIVSSPPRFSYSMFLASAAGARFEEDLQRATQLIQRGEPETIIYVSVPPPPGRLFTVRSHVDKYWPADRYDYFKYVPKVRMPLLLTLGSLEATLLQFEPLALRGPSLHDELRHIELASIDGADHSCRNRTAELSKTIRRWLQEQS